MGSKTIAVLASAMIAGVAPMLLIPQNMVLADPASSNSNTTTYREGDSGCGIGLRSLAGKENFTIPGMKAYLALSTSDLSRAAKLNNLSIQDFTSLLKNDKSVSLDHCGRVLFIDKFGDTEERHDHNTAHHSPAKSTKMPKNVFDLNSRPGASKTIYLDFDGHVLSGTLWNNYFKVPDGYVVPPMDLDGNTKEFSAKERKFIFEVWQVVAEDFAPFDINVTTAVPDPEKISRSSLEDTEYGTTALVTYDQSLTSVCKCAGVAWMGVVGAFPESSHALYQPAFVFQKPSSHIGPYPGITGKIISHEVGHNFGLRHDGTSTMEYYPGNPNGLWAPIMGGGGAGAAPITTWSIGEYADANNQEDDLEIIRRNAPYAEDDYSDSPELGAKLNRTSVLLGVIGQTGDVDSFKITPRSGVTTVTVDTQDMAPNLDAQVTVYDSELNIIASADQPIRWDGASGPTTTVVGTDASVSFRSTAGDTYFVSVSPVGWGNPLRNGYTTYGSLGRYAISYSTRPDRPLTIANSKKVEVRAGKRYRAKLAVSGGVAPYQWRVSRGSLPAGIVLRDNGRFAGKTRKVGTFTFVVTVTDGLGQTQRSRLRLTVK